MLLVAEGIEVSTLDSRVGSAVFGLLFPSLSEGTFNGNNCAFAHLCLNKQLVLSLERLAVTLL